MATMAENVIAAGKENGEMLIDSIKNEPVKLLNKITVKDAKGVNDIMTKQERESMLYDEFHKFTSEHGESIHSYYLRYAKLINDMKIIPMSMSNTQINTKFVNHLQPKWSRFVTAAKQARDLHSVNFDQLYAFLKHNERDAKEVREMRHRFPKPLALLENTYNPPPSYNSHQTQYQAQSSEVYQPYQHYRSSTPITQQLIQSPPLQTYAPICQGYTGNAGNNQASGARCTAKKRVKDSEWFKDKMLLAQAQEAGFVLNDEQKDFLANNLEETDNCEDLQLQVTTNFKADYIDAYDSDCDDQATTYAIFMANLSHVGSLNDDTVEPRYDSDILSEVPHYDTYHDSDMLNFNIQELGYIENIVSNNESYDELMSSINVISYTGYMLTIGDDADNYVPPSVQKNDMMLSVIEQIKSQVEKCNMVNQESKSVNESLTNELERHKEKVRILENAPRNSCSEKEAFLDRELRTVICDRNRKVSDYENQYFVPQTQLSAGQLFWSSTPSPPITVLKLKVFPKKLPSTCQVLKNLNKARELLTKFDECIRRRTTLSPHEIGSWEQSDIKECFEIEKKQLLINSERLLEENIASDIMCTYLRSLNEVDNCGKCKSLDIMLLDLQESNKSVSSLVKEREYIKLEYKKLYDSIKQTWAKIKLQTNSFQHKLNDQISKNNKLRAQLKGKFFEPQMNQNGTSVNTKLSKPSTSGTKLYPVTPLPKSKVIPKFFEKNDLSKSVTSHLNTKKIIEKCTKVLAPGLLKIESEPIYVYFKNNRVVHRDYLKVTKEHVATLQELLEEARALKPLDEHIGHASKFAERIQELLVYVSASCPFTQSGNEKRALVTSHRKNNKPYIDATKTKHTIEIIKQKHAVKQNTRKNGNTMLPSTGRVSFTNASGSKSKSNTKNDRIPQPSSRSMKNKVEAHHRKFKSSANKNNHVSDCNANVRNVDLSKNSDTICLSCNECLFSTNHDACVVQYLKKMQKRNVAKSAKQKVKSEWKPTGWIFKTVGIKWIPTGRTFNLVGKSCPLLLLMTRPP
ncbi:hypothetical protein Tco_0252455 [Tanacetum coccineum]